MALKSTDLKPNPVTEKQTVENDTVLLELALYTQYTWQGITYLKGTAYRFTKNEAMQLLSERDAGRQVWQIHRPKKAEGPKVTPVVDVTRRGVPATEPLKRIEVGTDDEIADILSNSEDSGDVTV